jgi:hypothetical protein
VTSRLSVHRLVLTACVSVALPASAAEQPVPQSAQDLERLSIEELAQIEVSTASRRPVRARRS